MRELSLERLVRNAREGVYRGDLEGAQNAWAQVGRREAHPEFQDAMRLSCWSCAHHTGDPVYQTWSSCTLVDGVYSWTNRGRNERLESIQQVNGWSLEQADAALDVLVRKIRRTPFETMSETFLGMWCPLYVARRTGVCVECASPIDGVVHDHDLWVYDDHSRKVPVCSTACERAYGSAREYLEWYADAERLEWSTGWSDEQLLEELNYVYGTAWTLGDIKRKAKQPRQDWMV